MIHFSVPMSDLTGGADAQARNKLQLLLLNKSTIFGAIGECAEDNALQMVLLPSVDYMIIVA
ncbi:MAG: hypothetical protein WCT03_04995 [Candidatus Obscuribacterales bacterium]